MEISFGLFVLIPLFAASIVRGEGRCKQIEFLPCETDKHLAGHVFKKIDMRVDDALQNCKHWCYEQKCISYNLAQIKEDKRVCELSNTDHVEHPSDVKSLAGAEYCAIKNPCVSNPCHSKLTCERDLYSLDSFKCIDKTSCASLKSTGKNENGVYEITPVPGYSVQVYCDQVTDGGGWTVIQRRLDGSVDFYRGWKDYKQGFGNKNGEYWLGLDAIHILTNRVPNEIRVDLKDVDGIGAYAAYSAFRVESELEKYRLSLGNFQGGGAGDSFYFQNSSYFTTFDSDNDKHTKHNCAVMFKGAWWYNRCHRVSSVVVLLTNLNGQYLYGIHQLFADGINWYTWKGYNYSAKQADMKIRPIGFGSQKDDDHGDDDNQDV
ncbi:ficolin-2-like [Actinia tenebrosa]|uniref:Ficolin-2-like n=1 Tax=Actinia tenebrosa TaxID=6105 RepID=A0A6P8IE60_ACTTE|nr:ficolin-2-like [Actinia tenebrosa]